MSVIPPAVKIAAKRAYFRTMLQGYEGWLAAGISVSLVLSLVRGEVDWVEVGATTTVGLIAPQIAGLRAWMNFTRKGIPGDYVDAAVDQRFQS